MAQQYLTAEQLGITELEHQALIATMDVLRQEQMGFDMGDVCSVNRYGARGEQPCNSNCCIGGAMSILTQNGMKLPERITPEMSRVAHDYVANQEPDWDRGVQTRPVGPLYRLFFDETNDTTTPSSGITAIERFLTGREPWDFGVEYRDA